jgi:hypothetical protein
MTLIIVLWHFDENAATVNNNVLWPNVMDMNGFEQSNNIPFCHKMNETTNN